MKKALLSILLTAALLTVLAAPALADALGEPVDEWSVDLTGGATLSGRQFWTGSDLRTETCITLAPGSAAVPVAVSAEPQRARQTLAQAAATLEAQGLHVLGGTNGGFYTLATDEPSGYTVSGGRLLHDSEGLQAVGFRADGSVVFGNPAQTVALCAQAQRLPVLGWNRSAPDALSIYTPGCAAAVPVPAHARCVLLDAPELPGLSGDAAVTVERVWESEGASETVPEGRLLLLLPPLDADTPAELPDALSEGAALTLELRCAEGWEDVDSALGIVYPLLENGAALPKLNAAAAPRAAIGVRADGTLLLYVLDGRQSGYSVGGGLDLVAQRLRELGCVTAGALDGGGSAQLAAFLPGEGALRFFNRPSEGSARSVTNYVLLAARTEPLGAAEALGMEPLHVNALAGATLPLTVRAFDRNGYGASLPEGLTFTVSDGLGEVVDGVYHAAGTGSGTITVSAPGVRDGVIPVRVTESPDELVLYGEKYGRKTESLTLEPWQTVDLTVRAYANHVLLSGHDACCEWTLDPDAGSVDQNGRLTPGEISTTGDLTVRAGACSVTIPITVWTGVPFRDVKRSDERFTAVKYVYDNGVFEGTSAVTFEPETVMTRGMLVTVLWRMEGKPEASQPAAFADVAPEEWYADAVAWAAEAGIVKGYSADAFGPKDDLTREQILTIFHRWAGEPATAEDAPRLRDESAIPDWALDAVRWTYALAIAAESEITGEAAHAPMPRADVAEVLMRYALFTKTDEG